MSWMIDTTHTSIEFSVKHMMFTTVRGRFNTFNGTLHLDETNPAKSYAEGVIETTSLDTRDTNRDAHLRPADFFDVEKFPQMKFRSTRVEPAGKGHYKIAGNLTVKDITREVVFDVTSEGQGQDPWGNQRRGFSAETSLNRKDFGLTWNVALEIGGWLVGDQVKIQIDLEVIKQAEAELVPA